MRILSKQAKENRGYKTNVSKMCRVVMTKLTPNMKKRKRMFKITDVAQSRIVHF